MKNNMGISEMKYYGIVVVILLTFLLFLGKSFDLLDESTDKKESNVVSEEQLPLSNNSEVIDNDDEINLEQQTNEENEDSLDVDLSAYVDIPEGAFSRKSEGKMAENITNSNIKKESLNKSEKKKDDLSLIEFEDLNDPQDKDENQTEDDNVSSNSNNELTLSYAKNKFDNGDHIGAINTYMQIVDSNDDMTLQAKCYDNIARIYAIDKRYGSALIYAQKAYHLQPTSNREMFVAKLYYKTGNLDNATKKVNDVLQRDFVND